MKELSKKEKESSKMIVHDDKPRLYRRLAVVKDLIEPKYHSSLLVGQFCVIGLYKMDEKLTHV